MLTGLLVSLLVVTPAAADETGDPPPVETIGAEAPPPPDPTTLLQEAITLYLDGRPAEARAALEAVLALGPALPGPVREDALAYLGDVLYSEQGEWAARGVFEALLAESPTYRMDPFNHPPEVVKHFEELRRELVLELPLPETPRERDPYPWMVALPVGVHYFKERRVIPGLTVAALQIGGAGVSIWARGELLAIPNHAKDPESGIAATEDSAGYKQRYERLQVANITAAAVGWGAYVVPVAVESIRWGARGRATLSVGPTSVGLSGSF